MARRRPDAGEPLSVWSEKDMLGGKAVDALVIILRSRGCCWSRKSGCLMCGYNRDSLGSVTPNDLVAQFEKAMAKHAGQPYIKIYTSGSFLDPGEIEPETRAAILKIAGEKAGKVLVESRPEFVSRPVLEDMLGAVNELEVAVGLETADDGIRARSINKGFLFSNYERACSTAADMGASIRTYLLLKPPYLTERGSIDDALVSIERAGKMSQSISVNPMNVQRGTVVEGLWKRNLYRPPWLWSLAEVLERGSGLTNARLMSAPSGGGSKRGTHNCGKCDDAILKAIETFSLEGDRAIFKGLGCGCRDRWLDYLDAEPFMGSAGDLGRLAAPK
jgi:hypothetical protein